MLSHRAIVGVGVKYPVTVGTGRTRVGHTDGASGRAGGRGLILIMTTWYGDGQRSHATIAVTVLVPGW